MMENNGTRDEHKVVEAKEMVDGWVRCRECNHKLARITPSKGRHAVRNIEFKCHSCKVINVLPI